RHAASVPTSACVKVTLAPAVSSSAATRWPRSPSRSQNATLAPSATKRLTVASPFPDAPPVTAANLPSSLPMFATFHCIAKRGSTIRPYPSGGHRLVCPAWVSDLNRLRKLQASAFGTFRWATRSGLGRIEPLPLAWSCDRLREGFRPVRPVKPKRRRCSHCRHRLEPVTGSQRGRERDIHVLPGM